MKTFRNPSTVTGRNFTFGCIFVISVDSSLESESSGSLNPIISPLVLRVDSPGCSLPLETPQL